MIMLRFLDLIRENATLRGLVKEMSAFLGGGEGGFVNRLGMNWDDFAKFIDRADTDTAYEGWATRRESQKASESQTKKRQHNGDGPESSRKRVNSQDTPQPFGSNDDRPVLPVASPSLSTPWSPLTALDASQGLHNLLGLRPSPLHPMVPGPSNFSSSTVPIISNPISTFSDPSTSSNHASQTPTSHTRPASPPQLLAAEEVNEMSDIKTHEAIKLVRYHLDNYRRNDAYCLPISLRPSLVQRFLHFIVLLCSY